MLYDILMFAQVIIAVFLVIIILLQRSDGGMGALGGDSGGGAMGGRKSADGMTKTTTWLGVAFMVVCLLLATQSAGTGRAVSVIDRTPENTLGTPLVPSTLVDDAATQAPAK